MKKFTIQCDFNGQTFPVDFYIGTPEKEHNPIHFQSTWLSKNRGGMVPGDVMNALSEIHEISKKEGSSLEELCVQALQESQDTQEDDEDT